MFAEVPQRQMNLVLKQSAAGWAERLRVCGILLACNVFLTCGVSLACNVLLACGVSRVCVMLRSRLFIESFFVFEQEEDI